MYEMKMYTSGGSTAMMNMKRTGAAAMKNRAAAALGALRFAGAIAIAPLVLALAACASGSGAAPKAPASPAATTAAQESNPAYVKAQELFTANKCISCHGVGLEGKAGPKTNLQKVGSMLSKEEIANQIKNGGGGMPVYKNKLSDEEVGLLTDWLSSKK
jgi:cytochrome c551